MAISPRFISLLSLSLAAYFFKISSAQTCSNYTFTSNKVFSSCNDLPHLEGHLHWNYFPSTNTVELAYRAKQTPSGWIAWAINPTAKGMVGSQALVAFYNDNGTLTAYPTPITSYSPSMLPGDLSFQVSNISAEYLNEEMIIYATVGQLHNGTTVDHVWQAGNSVSNNIPQMHSTAPSNVQSMARLDFLST